MADDDRLYFRQLLCGRDIARNDPLARQMVNFVYLVGDRETGGGLALPVWIDLMAWALKGVPVLEPFPPGGLINAGGLWMFEEFAGDRGVSSVGLDDKVPEAPSSEERNSILDLFRR